MISFQTGNFLYKGGERELSDLSDPPVHRIATRAIPHFPPPHSHMSLLSNYYHSILHLKNIHGFFNILSLFPSNNSFLKTGTQKHFFLQTVMFRTLKATINLVVLCLSQGSLQSEQQFTLLLHTNLSAHSLSRCPYI